MINRENYELYFIDLLDGTLPAETVDELLDFMRDNPDLAAELKGLENINVKAEKVESFNFNHLLKSDLEQNGVLDETCIRSIENDLRTEEEAEFKTYLATHPKARKHFKLFQSTISVPDLFIVYKNTESLKRKNRILPLWYAAAAVVVIGLLTWIMVPQPNTTIQLAQIQTVVEPLSTELPKAEINTNQLIMVPTEIEMVKEQKEVKAMVAEAPKDIQVEKNQNDRFENLPNLAFINVSAEVYTNQNSNLALAKMPAKKIVKQPYYPTIPELIAQEVNKIDAKKEARKIGRFALNKLKDFSDDKLNFATNKSGQINKIEYNSRLLAFSVPVNTKNN